MVKMLRPEESARALARAMRLGWRWGGAGAAPCRRRWVRPLFAAPVRARGGHIHGRLGYHAVRVADEEVVERVLLRAGHLSRQVLQVDLAVVVLHQRHLWQVLEPLGFVRRVEQVVAALVVDLQVRDAHLVVDAGRLGQLRKDVRDRTRYQAAVDIPLGAAGDGEGLATARLPVREDGPIVAGQDTVDDGLRDNLEDAVLRDAVVQHPAERECVVLLLVVHARAVALEAHVERVIGIVDLEARRRSLRRAHATEDLDVRLLRGGHCAPVGSNFFLEA